MTECTLEEFRRVDGFAKKYSLQTLYRKVRRGDLPARKSGGRWLIDVDGAWPNFQPPDERAEYIAEVKKQLITNRLRSTGAEAVRVLKQALRELEERRKNSTPPPRRGSSLEAIK